MELKDGGLSLSLDQTGDRPLAFDDEDLHIFIAYLKAFAFVAPLASFFFKGKPGNGYKYGFVSKDGRKWSQKIEVPGDSEAAMTFDVPDPWKQSEFVAHRPVRDAAIQLAKAYSVTKIECVWP